jgi:hypothetical protein
MKTLFAGPFIGEFGWELFCWQGYLRKLAQQGRYDNVVVSARSGHELLYKDFATEFIPYDPPQEETDMWMNRGLSTVLLMEEVLSRSTLNDKHTKLFKTIPSGMYKRRWWDQESWEKQQSLIFYGGSESAIQPVDVLMIIRDTEKCGTGFRNWPLHHAEEFAHVMRNLGLKVAFVGKRGSAQRIDSYFTRPDFRDAPLSDLSGIMKNAKVIVGPQCGATHFASLCLLQQVCWQTKAEHAHRMRYNWNPFGVPVRCLPAPSDNYWRSRTMWLPTVKDLVRQTCLLIEGKGDNAKMD